MRLFNFFFKSEKNKAIAVVTLVVVTLTVAFSYQGIMLHNATIDQVILTEEKSIESAVNDINTYLFAPYEQRLFNLLSTHEEIPKALKKHDRDRLYNLTLPLYKALKRENKYLQVMHYHLPDGHSFLRMHKRKKFGDDLRKIRQAVQFVHQKRTPLLCYEIGIYGTFYRIIHPVFHDGAYVGALELGIKAHSILESLQKHISTPMTTYYLVDRWKKVTKPSSHEFLVFGENTINTHDNQIYKQLPVALDLTHDNQIFTLDGKSYLLHTYPIFKDYKGKLIGGLVVLQDISQPLTAKRNFILHSLVIACFLLALALVVLHLSFGKLITKLGNSQSSWERTFDAIGDVVTIMNSNFEIIKANKAAYKILDAEPGSLKGEFCHEVFSDRPSVCDGCPGIDTINNCQASSAEIEHENLGKTFLITTSPVPDENGEFTHIVHIAKDITEIKELENRLQQSQKMEAIGTLAGGIAHDFNNILTAISGYTQLVIMKAGDDKKISDNLKQVTDATERAKNLVQQILTFSRQTEHALKAIEISPIIKEALKFIRSSIPTSIELKQNIESQRNVLADPTQIHQIVMNLSTNAYHAMMETGGILTVSLQEVTISEKGTIPELEIPPGDYVRLEVSDTGFGMDKATQGKIFDPYFTTKEVGKGTGLGLAVVHGIVTSHDGFIKVYSEPGDGTTFHVYLPIIEEEADDYQPQAEEEIICTGSERIMFIDDEEIISNLVSEVLPIYGYKISIFTNGVQAMQEFTKHPDEYDLIITDMSMPYMTGLQLSQKIKEIRPHLPIILCSGHSEIANKEKALAIGISKYIQKPLDMDKLARAIRKLMDTNKDGETQNK